MSITFYYMSIMPIIYLCMSISCLHIVSRIAFSLRYSSVQQNMLGVPVKLEDADNLEEVTAYQAAKEKDEKDPKKLKTEGPAPHFPSCSTSFSLLFNHLHLFFITFSSFHIGFSQLLLALKGVSY